MVLRKSPDWSDGGGNICTGGDLLDSQHTDRSPFGQLLSGDYQSLLTSLRLNVSNAPTGSIPSGAKILLIFYFAYFSVLEYSWYWGVEIFHDLFSICNFCIFFGHVAELVYAYASEAYGVTLESSSLSVPTFYSFL